MKTKFRKHISPVLNLLVVSRACFKNQGFYCEEFWRKKKHFSWTFYSHETVWTQIRCWNENFIKWLENPFPLCVLFINVKCRLYNLNVSLKLTEGPTFPWGPASPGLPVKPYRKRRVRNQIQMSHQTCQTRAEEPWKHMTTWEIKFAPRMCKN